VYDSAASRPKQGVFSVADFANDEATDDHHGHNMVGITLFLFQPAGCCDFCGGQTTILIDHFSGPGRAI